MPESELRACFYHAEGFDDVDQCMKDFGDDVEISRRYDICKEEASPEEEKTDLTELDACKVSAVRDVANMMDKNKISSKEYGEFIDTYDIEELPAPATISDQLGWKTANSLAGLKTKKWTEEELKSNLLEVAEKSALVEAEERLKEEYGIGWEDLSKKEKKELVKEKADDLEELLTIRRYQKYRKASDERREELPTARTISRRLGEGTWSEALREAGIGKKGLADRLKKIVEKGGPTEGGEISRELDISWEIIRDRIIPEAGVEKVWIPSSNIIKFEGNKPIVYQKGDKDKLADVIEENITVDLDPDLPRKKKREITTMLKDLVEKGYLDQEGFEQIHRQYAPSMHHRMEWGGKSLKRDIGEKLEKI